MKEIKTRIKSVESTRQITKAMELVSSSKLGNETVYKTYGKGIMQSTYVNVDGSAVKLTTAEIFWPISYTSIHKVGVIGKDTGKILKADKNNSLSYALELVEQN